MNPIADALRDLVSRDEASFGNAPRDPAIGTNALRARRRRLAIRTGIVAVSAAALAVSGIAVASALDGRGLNRDPATPPLPLGDTRVVIKLPVDEFPDITADYDFLFGSQGGACGDPLPLDRETDTRFSLVVDSIVVGNPDIFATAEVDGMMSSSTNPLRWLRAEATLGTLPGLESGWTLGPASWTITRVGDNAVVSSGWTNTSYDEAGLPSGNGGGSLQTAGAVALEDCAKIPDGTTRFEAAPQDVVLDPGTYDLRAIAVVRRTGESAVMANLPALGLDPSWLGADWRETIPCADAVEEARVTQDSLPVYCLPRLHYQWIFGNGDARAFAIVDAPASIVGEDQRVMVVAEPVPFTVD